MNDNLLQNRAHRNVDILSSIKNGLLFCSKFYAKDSNRIKTFGHLFELCQ